jgi:hypothetical protein
LSAAAGGTGNSSGSPTRPVTSTGHSAADIKACRLPAISLSVPQGWPSAVSRRRSVSARTVWGRPR